MFSHLSDFGYKRSGKEALGFYLAYLFLALILGGMAGGLLAVIVPMPENPDAAFELGVRAGTFTSFVATLVVGFLVLKGKKMQKDFLGIFLVILGGLLALLIGGIASFIPIAYLTTRPIAGSEEQPEVLPESTDEEASE